MLALKSVGAVALFGIFNAAEGRLMMAPTPGGSSAPDISDEKKKEMRDKIKQCLMMGENRKRTKHCMKKKGEDENMSDDEIIKKLTPPLKPAVVEDVLKNCPDFDQKMNACFDALK